MPIVPGIKLMSIKDHLRSLPSMFHCNIPEELANAVEDCRANSDVREVGIAWAIEQCRGLIAHGVPCIHFYTMGRSYGVKKVAEAVF